MKRNKLPTVVSLVTFATVAVAPAWSAEEEQATTEIGEIVVSATRQETNLQDTPDRDHRGDGRCARGARHHSVGDLTSVVPNAQFRRAQGAFGPGVTAFIRGVGTGDTSLGGRAGRRLLHG